MHVSAAARDSCDKYIDRHESWFAPLSDEISSRAKVHKPVIAAAHYAKHCDGFLDEPPDDYEYDNADTQAPDSESEPLLDDDHEEEEESVPGGARDLMAAPTVPAIPFPGYKRRVVEFCCNEDSKISNRAPDDCEVIRLTISDDLTTPAGLKCAYPHFVFWCLAMR